MPVVVDARAASAGGGAEAGEVPGSPMPAERPGAAGVPDSWAAGEDARNSFRRIVPVVMPAHRTDRAIGVCSTLQGEGASWVVSGLACAIAEVGQPVSIVDANRLRPAMSGQFELAAARPGGSERADFGVLSAFISIVDWARRADSLRGDLAACLASVRRTGQVVLVDLEPMQESAQALGLGGALDAVLLVVEAERERREVIRRSVEALTRAGHHVAGAVLNKRMRPVPDHVYRWL